MRPASICLLSTGLVKCGAETQLCRIATGLATRGHSVSVVTLLPPEAFVDELRAVGVPVFTVGMNRTGANAAAIIRLFKTIKRLRPDVVTSFNFHANLLGRLAGFLAGVPVVVTSIRTERLGSKWRERSLRLTDRLGKLTSTNSRTVATKLVDGGVVLRDRIRVIPNGLDLSRYRVPADDSRQLRDACGVAPGEFFWLAVGRLEPAKDYPTLIQAVALLAAQRAAFRVCIAGAGPLHAELQAACDAAGIASRISFLGLRDDVPTLMAAADALIMSSAWEGSPNAVLESLAAATPVVATDVGGVRELVIDGTSGFVVPPRQAAALARGMAQMMACTPEARTAMGAKGREHVAAIYGLDQVVSQWDALFQELLEEAA